MKYDWPKLVQDKVEKFAKANKLEGKTKDEFIKRAYEKFDDARVPIHEPVGLLCAQSMGEPATQLILRTKHYAGAAEVSIGSGIERLEELVDGRVKTKHPTMTIYIKDGFKTDEKSMAKYVKDVVYKKLADVCNIKEDLAKKSIVIKYDKALMKDADISKDDIKEKVKAVLKIKPKETPSALEFVFEDTSLVTIRKYFTKVSDVSIKGIAGIVDAIIVKDDDGIPVIKTQGTAFKKVNDLEFVDPKKTFTNDIFETARVLGIEAARNLIVDELYRVYNGAGISLDLRHIYVLADTMCFDGSVKGVVRTGIVSTKKSPFARAAFEQTEKVLFDVSFNKEVETFDGVVENVMAGLPIKVGVGNIGLKMEFKEKK